MKNIEDINKAAIQKITANRKITEFSPGDTIKVGVKIVEGKKVPEVLFSGDHAKIKGWRLSQSEAITQRQRPDLWKKYLEKKNEKH